MTTTTTTNTNIKTLAEQFDAQTKRFAKSCKFAYLNLSPNGSIDSVWGDFKNKSQALKIASMWALAFRGLGLTLTVEVKDSAYRVTLTT